MASVTMTAEEAEHQGRIDKEKVAATTEADIRGHLAEDGFDPDAPFRALRPISPATQIRRKTGLSQEQFADALRIPVSKLQEWERGRARPDPVAVSLLALVDDDPARAFSVLSKWAS